MAATLKKVSISMIFANGNNSDGTVKTVSLSIGQTIDATKYTDTKALAIVDAVRDLISLSLYNTRKVETYDMTIE